MNISKDYTLIGIDGGGTHTRGLLVREGKIAAESKSGTTRIGAVGVGESCERTLNVIIDLCKKAEIEASEIDAIVVGVAGAWLEEEKQRSARLIKTLAKSQDFLINEITVTSDAEIALRGAFDGGKGITTIIGTGSIALGNPNNDKLVRCGGWGIELDDEGSGAWIGREGLTAVARSLDGRGEKTILTEKLVETFPSIDLKQPRTIVKAYAEGVFQYAQLSPIVMDAAVNKDKVAMEIIEEAAVHLAELPAALIPYFKEKVIDVALLGGIIENDTLLSKLLIKEISKNKKLKLVESKGTALHGALAMATELAEEID